MRRTTKQKYYVPYTFSASIIVSEIIRQSVSYKYIFELPNLAVRHGL
jgi:hypothetical protein